MERLVLALSHFRIRSLPGARFGSPNRVFRNVEGKRFETSRRAGPGVSTGRACIAAWRSPTLATMVASTPWFRGDGPRKLFPQRHGRRCALAGDPAARTALESPGLGAVVHVRLPDAARPVQPRHYRSRYAWFQRSNWSDSAWDRTGGARALRFGWPGGGVQPDLQRAGGRIVDVVERTNHDRMEIRHRPVASGSPCLAPRLPLPLRLAAYEKSNSLFVAMNFRSARCNRRGPAPRSETHPALTLKAKWPWAPTASTWRSDAWSRRWRSPQGAVCPIPLWLEAYLGNDLVEALPRFRKARQLSPTNPRAALYLGLTRREPGPAWGGVISVREAVRLDRSAGELHAETLLPGARLLLLLGAWKKCDAGSPG